MAYPADQVRPIEHTDQAHADRDQYSSLVSFFVPFVMMLAVLFSVVWVATSLRNDAPQMTTESNARDRATTVAPTLPMPGPSAPAPSPSK